MGSVRSLQDAFVSTECLPDLSTESVDEDGFFYSVTTNAAFFNFSEASALCREQTATELASILSDEEQQVAEELIFDSIAENPGVFDDVNVWIGLADLGPTSTEPTTDVFRFSWLDESSFTFGLNASAEPWADQEPNNFDDLDEACVEYFPLSFLLVVCYLPEFV